MKITDDHTTGQRGHRPADIAEVSARLRAAVRRADPAAALTALARRHDPRLLLRELAALQDGQYAIAQARALDLGRHATAWLVSSGRTEPVARGVARYVGLGEPDPAVTAFLRCWPVGTIGYDSAALHHGLATTAPAAPDLIVPHGCHRTPAGVQLHQSRELERLDRLWVGAVAYTSLARTVCDLADGDDPSSTLARLDDAVAAGASRRWLHERATALTDGRDGVALIRDATSPTAAAELRSWLERLAAIIYRAAHLPEPSWNAPVRDDRGQIGLADALWERYRVISEKEGLRFHTSPRDRRRDAARFNRTLAAGYDVRRFAWRDVVDTPVDVAVTVAKALRGGGADIDLAAIPRHIELPRR